MPTTGPFPQLRAALLAALIAVMIWAYAEGESVSSRNLVLIVSFPRQPVGDVMIRPDPSFTGYVRVRVEGNARTIETASGVFMRELRLSPGKPGVPDAPGHGNVDLRAAIGDIPELAELKGALADIEPRSIGVDVIKLVSREVPVRAQLEGEAALDVEPTCSPSSVTLRIPAEEAKRIPDGASAVALVSDHSLRRLHLSGGGDGNTQTVVGIVRAPDEAEGIDPLIVSPEQVTVSLRLKRRVETVKIPSVPVWVSLPAAEDAGQWIVDVQDKAITDVVVVGPAAALEPFRTSTAPIRAMVELTREDLEKGVTSKAATFPGLPPGVTASADSQIVRIQRIARRDAAATPSKP
jgi:hypothetical protein